jgi:hypothetical protein
LLEINTIVDNYISTNTVAQAVQVLMTPCSIVTFKETKPAVEFIYFLGEGLASFNLPSYTQTPECGYKIQIKLSQVFGENLSEIYYKISSDSLSIKL